MTLAVAVVCGEGVAIAQDSFVFSAGTGGGAVHRRGHKLRFAGKAIIGAAFADADSVDELLFEDIATCPPSYGPSRVALGLFSLATARKRSVGYLVAGFEDGEPVIVRKRLDRAIEPPLRRGFASVGELESTGPFGGRSLDEAAAYAQHFVADYVRRVKASGQQPLVAEPIYTFISARDGYWQACR